METCDHLYVRARHALGERRWVEARHWARHSLTRAVTPQERFRSLTTLASAWTGPSIIDMENARAAAQAASEAITLMESHPPASLAEAAEPHQGLGRALRALGELEAAQRSLQRARAIAEQAHGADHPSLARFWEDLALISAERAESGEALACLETAVALLKGGLLMGDEERHRRKIDTVRLEGELLRVACRLVKEKAFAQRLRLRSPAPGAWVCS